MKGRSVVLALVAVLVLAAVAVWLALRESPEPDVTPQPGVETGTTAPPEVTASAESRRRARAGTSWLELGTGTVTGVVREFGTERPLADVAVTLSAGNPGPDRSMTARTGSDGSFRFPEVPNFEDWSLRVDAPAPLAPIEQAGVGVVENKVTDLGVLYVTPAFSVPGIVVDERGDPVKGAEVRALRVRTGAIQMDILRLIRELPVEQPAVDKATSGEDGRFRLTKTTAGSYDMRVFAPGREILVERQVIVTPEAEKRELRFVLRKGFQLEGRIVRKGPGSVAGIPVVAFHQPRGEADFLALDRSYTRSEEDGTFRLDGLGAAEYVVCATPPGEPFCVQDDVPVPGTTFLELVIEGDSWLEGRVTGKGGAAVAGAQVYVAHFEGRPSVGNARTDGDGRYVIRGLRSGRMQLFLVQAEGYATWPTDLMSMFTGGGAGAGVELKPGRNEKDVALEQGGTVKGVVLSKDDEKPIAGARVELASILAMFGGSRGGLTDAEGKFEITSAPLGASVLLVSKDGWFQPGLSPMSIGMAFQGGGKQPDTGKGYVISVTEPGQVIERTITLAVGSTLAGQVLSPEGEPVPGARVVLASDSDGGFFDGITMLLGGSDPRLADAEGRFEIAGPPPGTKARVVAKAAGYLEGRTEPMAAGVGQRIDGLVVTLRRGATIEGRVTDERLQPIEGALVRSLKTEGLQEWEVPWRLEQAQPAATDADGRYRLEHVEPGAGIVRIEHTSHVAATFEDVKTEEGKSSTVDAKLASGSSLTGRVLGPDSKPRIAATVTLMRQGGEESDRFGDRVRRLTTDSEGKFSAEGLVPGTYDVSAEAKGAAPSEKQTLAPAGQSVTLRLLPALRIAGTARASGRPALGLMVEVRRRNAGADTGDAGSRDYEHVGRAETDSEGRFAVEDLPAGNYDLSFEPKRWGGGERSNVLAKVVPDVAAGNEAVAVELEPGVSIRGTVVLEDGTPAPNGWTHAQQVAEDGSAVEGAASAWDSVENGEFEILGLAPGTYEVQVNVDGQGQKRLRVTAGGDPVKVVIGGGSRVTGLVVDSEGVPVSGAWVNVQNDQGGANAQTDVDGRYTVSGLAAGRYHVDAWTQGSGGRRHGRLDTIDVRERETVEAPTITVTKQE